MVFGIEWDRLQMMPADQLKGKTDILIVGGGTGQLLSCLGRDQRVIFVEHSEGMIRKAGSRKQQAKTTFVKGDYLEWECDTKFDAIVFPFFLDCFNQSSLQHILRKARHQLKSSGILLVLDFQRSGIWQNAMTAFMYRFFRLTTGLEARELLPIHDIVQQENWDPVRFQSTYGNWIFYGCYAPS